MYFFCLQVDGPITGRAYKRGAYGMLQVEIEIMATDAKITLPEYS